MSPCRRERLTLPTSPLEDVALRTMKASDLPHVRALHVRTCFLRTYNVFRLTITSSAVSSLSPIRLHSSSNFLSTRDSSA